MNHPPLAQDHTKANLFQRIYRHLIKAPPVAEKQEPPQKAGKTTRTKTTKKDVEMVIDSSDEDVTVTKEVNPNDIIITKVVQKKRR